MTIPAVVVLWVALALFVVILSIAATHVVFGVRFANRDRHILVATLAYLVVFVIMVALGALLVRSVDWSASWTISFPGTTSGGTL